MPPTKQIKKRPIGPPTIKPSLGTALRPSPQTAIKPTPLKTVSNPFEGLAGIPKTGKFIMFYGEPGSGKSTVAAQLPKPIFIITHGETGIDSAKKVGVADKDIPVIRLSELYKTNAIPDGHGHPAWEQTINTLNKIAQGGHDRRTVVIDTLSGLEKIGNQHTASLEFKGDMSGRGQDEWNAWAAGPRRFEEGYWSGEFIPACLSCIEQGYNVVLIAHAINSTVKNNAGPDYTKFRPDLAERIFNNTNKSLQYNFFFGLRQDFETDVKTKKRTVSATNRFIGISNDTWYTAKNWDNLEGIIWCGKSAKETYEVLSESITFD